MIIKKVPNPKGGGNAGRASGLINYIAALEVTKGIDHSDGAKQEKCVHFETANFLSENLQTQIKEMAALAASNAKSKNPIDHWILSWRSDEQPTPEQAREAVQIFMKHMKLQGHQVAWGLHEDTDNTHIHIAVNRINPITGKCVEINNRFGYAEAHKALAKIEHAQCWKPAAGAAFEVQNGKVVAKSSAQKEQDTKPIKPSIIDKELQTGEKSALRICKERAAPIIKSAKSWAELHTNLAAAGFQFERFGSGSKIHYGDVAVKASDVDRAASITALQKKLGPYQPPQEIKSNEYHQHTTASSRTATGAIVASKKPHSTQTRKQPSHGLRTLSECNLAYDKSSRNSKGAGVLFIDDGADNRGIIGLRRNDRRAEPLKPDQPAWTEYQAIRAERSTAKAAELLTLRTQHDADKDKLHAAHVAEREKLMDKDWRGKGDLKNMLSSTIATKQAAEKLELREQHKEQREALHARYVPLPQYKVWQQQPRLLAPVAAMQQHTSAPAQPERLSKIVMGLTHSQDRRGVAYQYAGQELFIDQGRTLAIVKHEQQSTRQIAAALAVAQHKFGSVLEVTGPDEFKQRAIVAAVEHNLLVRFADPAMESQRVQMIEAKLQAERDAQRAQREQQERAVQKAAKVQAQEQAAEALALDAAREAAEQAEQCAAAQVPAPQAQQPNTLDEEIQAAPVQPQPEPEIDYLADIQQQIQAAKAKADPRSSLANSTTTEADHDAPGSGVIVASNDEFVAVQQREIVKLYRASELVKHLAYDGTDTGHGRFAVGNELERKNGKDGMRTLITEEREHMQTEENSNSNSRGR